MYCGIAEAAKRCGISAYALRYYDKEGLLPFVERTYSGTRKFKESDFEWLAIIACLRETKMPIKQIKIYIQWCLEGNNTLKERLKLFLEHKKSIEAQIENMNRHLKKIDCKINYYTNASNAKTENIHKKSLSKMAKEQYILKRNRV
ncbi:MAG: MerR family transcriptional regulator [Campylobacteraceae bacterium]|jgi:DNA-binding transcriptional MerR regulator|nr:MerR family transcriptional regulator [Campylobacteraceae bacterium]